MTGRRELLPGESSIIVSSLSVYRSRSIRCVGSGIPLPHVCSKPAMTSERVRNSWAIAMCELR